MNEIGIKPMSLLLIEDDATERAKFKSCAENRPEVAFVAMTASSVEGLRYMKTRLPEGVILDLELHRGVGSGLQFLAGLNAAGLGRRPLVFVTTNSTSHVVYNHAHSIGADLVFYKRQVGYSADMIVNTMLTLRPSLHEMRRDPATMEDPEPIESPDEWKDRILQRIDAELDAVGISPRYKGRMYLREGILLMLNRDRKTSEAVVYRLAENHKCSYSSVLRAMQTAIVKTWDTSCQEDLQKYYTARVNIHTGVPAPTDFIYYYVEKIQKTM